MSTNTSRHITVAKGRLGSWHWQLARSPLAQHELAHRYDRLAPRWGRLVSRLGYHRSYRALFESLMAGCLKPFSDAPLDVLDCGVGTGTYASALCDASTVPVRLHAIDIAPAMVAAARAQFTARGIDASVQQASVEQLPFADSSFDIVIAAHVLEHLPDTALALSEMYRVLRPGGFVVLSLTRRSLLGTYVQTKWRTHCVTAEQCETWLTDARFEPIPLHAEFGGTYSRTSLTCLGRKHDTQSPREKMK